MVSPEVAAEVGELGVAQSQGDGFRSLTGGEQLRGADHALALEELARRAAELALAVAFKLAQRKLEETRGDGGLVGGPHGQLTPALRAGGDRHDIQMTRHDTACGRVTRTPGPLERKNYQPAEPSVASLYA